MKVRTLRREPDARVLEVSVGDSHATVAFSQSEGGLRVDLIAAGGSVELRAPNLGTRTVCGYGLSDSHVGPDVGRVAHARAAARWGERLAGLDHEELWVLGLNARNQLGAQRLAARGGISGLHVAVRDPLRIALRIACTSFVLVHNHPSGDPTPSEEDLSFTKRLQDASRVVGTPLLDHVVVGRDGFVSMLDAGMLPS